MLTVYPRPALKRRGFLFLTLLVLAAENVAIYWLHYFDTYSFPWDFTLSYHAVPYHWTTLIRLGVFPQWVPFQGMGYPLALNLQSGIFYAPYYAFVILPLAYTLRAAAVFQGLHVLVGAVGFYVLSRRIGGGWAYALLGAFAFQFFGGFFTNSEHPDIVRAYALTPWLFAALGKIEGRARVADLFSVVILPLAVYLMLTGGYPGVSLATLFIAGVFLLLECAFQRASWRTTLALGGLMLVGVLMAAVCFIPAMALMKDVVRTQEMAVIHKEFLNLKHLLTLFQPAHFAALGGDESMRSLHIGVPLVACLFFVRLETLKKYASWVALVLLAYALGSGGWLYKLVTALLPPLGLSRFPIADYRHLVSIGFIIIAVAGLEGGLACALKDWLGARMTAFWITFAISIYALDFSHDAHRFWQGLLLAAASLAVIALWKKVERPQLFLIPCLMGLLAMDAARVERGQGYWLGKDILLGHRNQYGDLAEINPRLRERVQGITCRPSRNAANLAAIDGYYSGEYMVGDYAGSDKFVRQQRIINNPALLGFASEAWKAVTVEDGAAASILQSIEQSGRADGVACTHYGINTETLAVNLDRPRTIVENEMYSRGWRGRLLVETGREIAAIEPIEVNGFRAWSLPAGRYRLIEEYRTPLLVPALAISLFGATFWLTLIACQLLVRRRENRKDRMNHEGNQRSVSA